MAVAPAVAMHAARCKGKECRHEDEDCRHQHRVESRWSMWLNKTMGYRVAEVVTVSFCYMEKERMHKRV